MTRRLPTTAILLALGCTDAALQPITEPVARVDATLSIAGTFCTSPPDPVDFPVKVVLVVDQSASLQCTDPANVRLAALDAAGQALDGSANVEFAVVGFASWSRTSGFSRDWADAASALQAAGGQGGPATDYQGALSQAARLIDDDLAAAGPAIAARSTYTVLFLSDGVPEPRCRAGCDDGGSLPDSLYGVCNTTRDIPEGEYVGMNTRCPAYNQPSQILTQAADLLSLADTYGVASLTLSTVLLWAPPEAVSAACGDVSGFGYLREEAEPLLRELARVGGGTYRDVDTDRGLDVLDLGTVSAEAPYDLVRVLPVNMRALGQPGGAVPDSDGDGLSDAEEHALGLDPLSIDSDGDGYSDCTERRLADRGHDPLDPTLPPWTCDVRTDRDGDGLADCEEEELGTDPHLADTDGDDLPDGLEVRFGLDPLAPDAHADPDRDGTDSLAEIRGGTHPGLPDDDVARLSAATVGVQLTGTNPDGRSCYAYEVQGLTQVVPSGRNDAKGRNRTLLLLREEPLGLGSRVGREHVVCVDSLYLGSGFKSPASGAIAQLDNAFVHELPSFDADRHCVDATREDR